MDQDLLGNPTTDVEKEVLRLYRDLKALVAREDAQACNALDLAYEQLYDLGI